MSVGIKMDNFKSVFLVKDIFFGVALSGARLLETGSLSYI